MFIVDSENALAQCMVFLMSLLFWCHALFWHFHASSFFINGCFPLCVGASTCQCSAALAPELFSAHPCLRYGLLVPQTLLGSSKTIQHPSACSTISVSNYLVVYLGTSFGACFSIAPTLLSTDQFFFSYLGMYSV